MFFVAIPYLICTGKFRIEYLPANLVALYHDDDILYISFSWYVKLHLLILGYAIFVRYIDRKYSKSVYHIASMALVEAIGIIGYVVCLKSGIPVLKIIGDSMILLCKYLPLFYIGMFMAKWEVLQLVWNKLKTVFQRFHCNSTAVSLMSCVFLILVLAIRGRFTYRNGQLTDMIYTPLVILFAYLFFENIKIEGMVSKLFVFLGKYSLQYWLLSGMFFLNTIELQWVLFWPKYSYLIFGWTFILLTPFAVICSKLASFIAQKLLRV